MGASGRFAAGLQERCWDEGALAEAADLHSQAG